MMGLKRSTVLGGEAMLWNNQAAEMRCARAERDADREESMACRSLHFWPPSKMRAKWLSKCLYPLSLLSPALTVVLVCLVAGVPPGSHSFRAGSLPVGP